MGQQRRDQLEQPLVGSCCCWCCVMLLLLLLLQLLQLLQQELLLLLLLTVLFRMRPPFCRHCCFGFHSTHSHQSTCTKMDVLICVLTPQTVHTAAQGILLLVSVVHHSLGEAPCFGPGGQTLQQTETGFGVRLQSCWGLCPAPVLCRPEHLASSMTSRSRSGSSSISSSSSRQMGTA